MARKATTLEERVFPRKLKNGRLAYDVRFRDKRGRNRSVTKYDPEEANRLASDIRFDRENPDLIPDMTLGEFFDRKETKDTIKHMRKLDAATRELWRRNWVKHVCHEDYGIAGMSLKELSRPAPIRDFLNAMTKQKVGEPMQVRVLGIVSAILNVAVEDDYIPRNPIKTMDGKPSSNRIREIYIPTIEVIELLRKEVLVGQSKHYRGVPQLDALIVSILAYEAPRPEELRLLSWTDADLQSKWLKIYAPKAERGKATELERKAPINDVVAEELLEWQEELGNPPNRQLIIASRKKKKWGEIDWRNWRKRVFKPALRRVADEVAKNPREHEQICSMRPYDLRHTGLSLWLANGGKGKNGKWDGSPANPVDVASWGGHHVRTLWDHYAKVIETAPRISIAKQIRDEREKIEKAMAQEEAELAEEEAQIIND